MRIPICHFLLKMFFVFFRNWHDVIFFVFFFKQHRENILYRFALSIAHDVDAGVYHLCKELMLQRVSPTITSDDAPYVPELQVIQKSIMSYTNLTNEQLIYIAGGF